MSVIKNKLMGKPIFDNGRKAAKKKTNVKPLEKEMPSVFENLKEAVCEMALFRAGKIKLRNIKELLSEL
jgi:hypothetical protein